MSAARPERSAARARPEGVRPFVLRNVTPPPAAPDVFEGATRGRVAAAALVFAVAFAYAVVRYVVVKGVPIASIPLYVTNKAVAIFAVALFAAAAARPAAPWRRWARAVALAAAALHGLSSLALLRPAYYASLHDGAAAGARMTGTGELAVLLGAAALVTLGAVRASRAPPGTVSPRFGARAGAFALALVVLHCAALGFDGWLAPRTWPAGLPPMTLWGALIGAIGLARAFARTRRDASRPG